jgi:hypothetical protein
MSYLCQVDRDLLACWTDLGAVPDDLSTQEARDPLLFKLWRYCQDLEEAMDTLMAGPADAGGQGVLL